MICHVLPYGVIKKKNNNNIVATLFVCGRMFNKHFVFVANVSKRSSIIGQYLAKIWAKVKGLLFWPILYIAR